MNRSEIIKLINSNPSSAFSQEINLDSELTGGRITGVYINTAILNGGIYINRSVPFECDIKGDNLKETGEKIFVNDGHNEDGYKTVTEKDEKVFGALENAGLTDFDGNDVNIYAFLNVWQLIEDIESLLEDMNKIPPHFDTQNGTNLQYFSSMNVIHAYAAGIHVHIDNSKICVFAPESSVFKKYEEAGLTKPENRYELVGDGDRISVVLSSKAEAEEVAKIFGLEIIDMTKNRK